MLVTVSVPDSGWVVAAVTVTSQVPLALTVHWPAGLTGPAPLHVYAITEPAGSADSPLPSFWNPCSVKTCCGSPTRLTADSPATR